MWRLLPAPPAACSAVFLEPSLYGIHLRFKIFTHAYWVRGRRRHHSSAGLAFPSIVNGQAVHGVTTNALLLHAPYHPGIQPDVGLRDLWHSSPPWPLAILIRLPYR